LHSPSAAQIHDLKMKIDPVEKIMFVEVHRALGCKSANSPYLAR
jgi:hypothetical protein